MEDVEMTIIWTIALICFGIIFLDICHEIKSGIASTNELIKEKQRIKRLKLQQEHEQETRNLQNKIISSGIIDRCSEIIDAYCKLSAIDLLGMPAGTIWIVIPKPQCKRLMGSLYAPSQDIEIIFDAFYDCRIFQDMLNKGLQSFISWGIPQILIDRGVSVSLHSNEKVKWTVKTWPPAGLYGEYDANSFDTMYKGIKSILETKYDNLKSLYSYVTLAFTIRYMPNGQLYL